MTVHNKTNNISNFKAGADLSAESNMYLAVKFDGNDDIILALAGDNAIGFLFNLPKLGAAAEVATRGGGALGIAGGTFAAGDYLKSDANSKLVVATTAGDSVIAQAMKSAVANDVVSIQPITQRIHA